MTTTINGSSPSITFSDGTTQTTAANITAPYTSSGVVYASSTTALATGSGLTFTGTNFGVGTTSPSYLLEVKSSSAQVGITGTGTASNYLAVGNTNASNTFYIGQDNSTGNNFNTGVAYGPVIWTNASSQTFVTDSGSNVMKYSSGNLLVGTTSTSGSVSNYGTVVGGLFKSFSGVTASTPSGNFVTLFTASSQFSGYIVTVYIAANDVNNYQSVVMVNTQAGSSTKVSVIVSSGLLSFQMSGYNLQASQSSGNASTISYSAIRIAA